MKRLLLALLASVLLHGLIVLGWTFVWRQAPLMGGGGEVSVEILAANPAVPSPSGSTKVPKKEEKRERTVAAVPGASAGPSRGIGSGPSGASEVLAQIRAKIERAKRYPAVARRMNIEGVSHVRFAIDADGRPQGLALKKSSGSSILDDEALSTIRRAAPFPAYEEALEIGIRFEIDK